MTRRLSNSVKIAGRLIGRHDQVENRRVPRIVFEVYNADDRDVFRAVVYGRKRIASVGPEIAEGRMVEIEGRLHLIRWRTPGTGRLIAEPGIEVEHIHALDNGGPVPQRSRQRASASHIAEIQRLADRLGLDSVALRAYLGGRDPDDVPLGEVGSILRQMAQEVQAVESRVRRGVQLDCLLAAAERPPAGPQPGMDDDNGTGVL